MGAHYGSTSPSAEIAEGSIRAFAKRRELLSDAAFTTRYLAGDLAAKRELTEITERVSRKD